VGKGEGEEGFPFGGPLTRGGPGVPLLDPEMIAELELDCRSIAMDPPGPSQPDTRRRFGFPFVVVVEGSPWVIPSRSTDPVEPDLTSPPPPPPPPPEPEPELEPGRVVSVMDLPPPIPFVMDPDEGSSVVPLILARLEGLGGPRRVTVGLPLEEGSGRMEDVLTGGAGGEEMEVVGCLGGWAWFEVVLVVVVLVVGVEDVLLMGDEALSHKGEAVVL